MGASKLRLASVSVDLDTLPHYFRIHGLDETAVSSNPLQAVYPTAVNRFQSLFRAAGIRATYFAIGEDLEHPSSASVLRGAVGEGMEVASHSYRHHYALSRQAFADISNDLRLAHETIERAVGVAPVGFRAPGYTLSAELIRAVEERGYLYDSSAFPAAPYYLAKATILGLMRLSGAQSSSILDSPKVLQAPREPYWANPSDVYRKSRDGVLELPITTGQLHRFPFIGTFALTFPWPLVQGMYASCRQTSHFNFELHAMDLLDSSDGLPANLLAKQKDARVSHEQKAERLTKIVSRLRKDFDVVTLAEAALAVRKQASFSS